MKPGSSPVDAAKRALAAHEASRPDVIKATHPNAPRSLLKAWEKWRDDHLWLRTQLEMAEHSAKSGWRDAAGNLAVPIWSKQGKTKPQTPEPKSQWEIGQSIGTQTVARSVFRKTAHECLEMMQSRIDLMNRLDPQSKEWRTARASALNYKCLVATRAKEDNIEPLPLPEIPTMPMESRLKPGVALGTKFTPEELKERERQRGIRRRAEDRRIAA